MRSTLRRPYHDEADDCVQLLYISGPHLYEYCFIEREPNSHEMLKLLYATPDTLYSQEHIVVEEEHGKIRGLLLAYPARDMKRLGMRMLKCLRGMFMISGVVNVVKMMFRLRLNTYFPGTAHDEFFISNLAVFEEHRGKGIAVKLLNKAEEMALEKGLQTLSLYVEIDNAHAKRVYEKFGFREVDKIVLPKTYHTHHLFGFHKFIKRIGKQ